RPEQGELHSKLHFGVENTPANTSDWENSTLGSYNNLESATYQNGVVSGKTDFHVDISKSPRGEFLFPR
ncbi:hypothetical protein, partial [uncultured Porphyromonas sp.]|uniref:hypothetical protein n=1 Tax=uncultured Porphyromonas sp. TaxID=159274 RepID=UPI002805B0A4